MLVVWVVQSGMLHLTISQTLSKRHPIHTVSGFMGSMWDAEVKNHNLLYVCYVCEVKTGL